MWALILDSRKNNNSPLLFEIIYLFLSLQSTSLVVLGGGDCGHSRLISVGLLSSFTDAGLFRGRRERGGSQ